MIDYSFNEIVIPTFGNFRKDCRSKWELILESLKRCSRNKMKAGKKEKEHRRATGDTFPMMHLGQTGYRCSHMISKFMITLHVASLQLTRHFNIIQKNLTISGKKTVCTEIVVFDDKNKNCYISCYLTHENKGTFNIFALWARNKRIYF